LRAVLRVEKPPKTGKTAKKRVKHENFIFLVRSKFSLYFFTLSRI